MSNSLTLRSTHSDKTSIQVSMSSPFFTPPKNSQNTDKILISKSYTPQLSKEASSDMSYLISNNSKLISDVVSYVPVLDRLTCNYLMPEANTVLRRTKSLTHIPAQKDPVQELNFSSSMLSDILPNTLSYADLTRFMQSPQYKVHMRGQTPTFEKILAQLRHSTKKYRHTGPIDLTDFFKRDEELIAKKEKMANPPPPEIKLASSLRTVKIANNAEKKKSRIANIIALQKAEQAASEKKTKIKPHTNSTYVHSRFNLAQTSEISTNIKMVRQQICEYKANKTKCKEEDVENKKQFHVSPKNKQLALKADMRHKQNSSKLENMETPKKNRSMKYSRKTPLYISEITNFVYSMKKCNRELR